MRKWLGIAIGALAAVGMSVMSAQAENKTIRMGTMFWENLATISGVTKKVLEDAGYTVEVTTFSEWGIAFAALAKGDAQILVAQTDYVAHDYWNRTKNRLEKISPVSHGYFQGIAVPSYVPIDSIEQLNEHADQLGNRIVGIEPGSGLMRASTQVVSEYDLKLQLIEGSSAGMAAALQSAIDRNEWIAVTFWEPSWMAQRFDFKWLQDPKGVYPPVQSYYWIGTKGFSEENPHAREVIASVFLPLADNNAINAEVNAGKPMDDAVADWIAANADLIQRWSNIKEY